MIQAAERELMSATLRRLAEEFDGTQLSEALDDFGFADLLTEEPRAAVSSLFDAAGRTGSMPAAFQDVLLLPLFGVLDDVTPTQSVVLPVTGAQFAGSFDGEAVSLRGLVIGARTATAFLAPVAKDGKTAWVRVADPSALSTRTVAGLDPALGMVEVSASGLPAAVVSAGPAAAAGWDAVLHRGPAGAGIPDRRSATRMLDLAVAHARSRVQFGRPIGSFQAVRNRLADTYVAREAAAAALELAWEADDEYLAGMLAKSLAVGRRGSRPPIASKCWLASASPQNTRSTTSWPVPWCWIRCWAQPPNFAGRLALDWLRHRRSRGWSSCERRRPARRGCRTGGHGAS